MARSGRSHASPAALLREQRYRRRFLDVDRTQNAYVIAVVGACMVVLARNDLVLLGGTRWLLPALLSRFVEVLAAIAALLFLRRARSPLRHDRVLMSWLVVATILHNGSVATRLLAGEVLGPLTGAITILSVLYFAQRGPITPRALSACATTAVTLALLWAPHAQISSIARVTSTAMLLGLNLIGVVAARTFEEQRRERFEAERRERLARQALALNLRELAIEKERALAMARARAAFLAMMSHELRTPMNAILGLSDVLLEAPLAAEHHGLVSVIHDSARALLTLLNDVLDFAKIDAQKLVLTPAPFDLHRLVASVVDMLRPSAAMRALDLSLDLAAGLPQHFTGDEARVRQVLVNLVSNAVKFTERGAVRLQISARPLDGDDHEITFRVEDTGIGLTPTVIARLFHPFEQGDRGIARRFGGTGLGLAISKQIVARMGGDILVVSEPGRGSVFSFTLRLPAAPPPEAIAALSPASREARAPLAILVVDDHPINLDVARARLGRLGYAVDFADSGPAAIEAASKRDYDVVFMDLQMPGMSGIEAAARIGERSAGKRAPHIIAMTASVFEDDREACRRAGMCDFVGKPIELPQLDAVLRRVADDRGAGVPSLTKEALAKLRQVEKLGEPRFFQSLCAIFLADTQVRLPRMRDALARADVQAIASEAHALKSSSATLGAREMAEHCARVEGAAREGRLDELSVGIESISAQLVDVERALSRELAGWHTHQEAT